MIILDLEYFTFHPVQRSAHSLETQLPYES